ncbi:unnamed protein product [Ceratitis capitata]|uniref:(Mediterranean fruit fly) hypothetical protein n=1 Tax=Ceratitis capitata TaxID=7213 RepID=A0A811UYR8_CERCA|nr:unnamed protein product [Ceratitis capitata]
MRNVHQPLKDIKLLTSRSSHRSRLVRHGLPGSSIEDDEVDVLRRSPKSIACLKSEVATDDVGRWSQHAKISIKRLKNHDAFRPPLNGFTVIMIRKKKLQNDYKKNYKENAAQSKEW